MLPELFGELAPQSALPGLAGCGQRGQELPTLDPLELSCLVAPASAVT